MNPIPRTMFFDQIYVWWYKHAFSEYDNPPKFVNLCPYMRAILIWAPLRWIFLHGSLRSVVWGSFIGMTYASFMALAIEANSLNWAYLLTALFVLSPVVFTSTIVLVEVGFFLLVKKMGIHTGKRLALFTEKADRKTDALADKVTDLFDRSSIPAFFKLVKQWLHSSHDMICPSIERE